MSGAPEVNTSLPHLQGSRRWDPDRVDLAGQLFGITSSDIAGELRHGVTFAHHSLEDDEHQNLEALLVFCRMDGEMMNSGEIKWPLWRACKRAGLRRIGWHVLRHTFASHLVMRGAPLKAVQELLAHATIMMTMRYAHLAPEISREAVKLLDARGKTVAKPPRLSC